MAKSAGYWIELSSIKFDEGNSSTWIQAMPLGSYEHPTHGTIDITPERVLQFAANVNNKARGQDLDIDYDHKDKSGEAAAWVKQAEARPDGLWLLVDWTTKAAQQIKDKAYRYFSPEFVDEWTHPKTQQKYKDVLFGGAITNRPFLKDILPINMSEVFEHAGDQQMNEGGTSMTPEQLKALAKLAGLPEDATAEQIYAAAEAKAAEKPDEKPAVDEPVVEPVSVAASEDAAIKKLAEDNPAVKALVEMVNAQGIQLAETNKKLREADTTATVAQLSEKATKAGYAIPPVTVEALTKALNESPKQLGESVVSAFESLLDASLVKLGESGHGKQNSGNASASDKMAAAVVKLREQDKDLSYADAVVRVAADDPMLFSEYQTESYAGRE
jgi:phage I-like protein